MNKVEFSFVLPAYNEEKNIAEAISKAKKFLERRYRNFEIIVVDDGSSDRTGEIIKKAIQSDKNIKLIRHVKNVGYGATVWDGLKAATGELVFFTDSDLQFDLNDLKSFFVDIKSFDVVIGYRKKRVEGWRRKLNVLGWKLACFSFLGIKFKDIDCAFKLFKKDCLSRIKINSKGATFSAELLMRLQEKGCKIKERPVKHLPRLHGKPTGGKFSVIFKAFGELYKLLINTPRLLRSRARILEIFVLLAIIASRFFMFSNSRDFFDSSEYLWRLKIPELSRVVTSGHPPFHPMYVGLASIFYKIGITIHDGITAGIIPSALLGCVSLVFIYLLVKELFGRKTALLSLIIYSALPFVWVSQITILVDPTMHGFYFASLYVFVLSLKNKGVKALSLAGLSGILLGAAAFTHTSIAFWITAYFGIWLIKMKRLDLKTVKDDYLKFILLFVFSLWAIAAYVYLLMLAYRLGIGDGKPTIASALKYLLLGNVSDKSSISLYLSLKYYLTLSTVMVAFFAMVGFVKMVGRKTTTALGFFVWFVPSTILTANYIYENLHGRAMIPSLLPTVILCSLFILSINKKFAKYALTVLVIAQVGYLGLCSALKYKNLPSPNEQIYLMQKDLEEGGVFISSNITRTWNEYKGDFISFGDVGQGANEAEKAIQSKLDANKKAYVSLDAVLYPRRRFDGMYYDIRANAGGRPASQRTLLNNLFEGREFKIAKMNSLFNQAFFELKDKAEDRFDGLDTRAKEHKMVFGRVMSEDKAVSVVSVNAYQKNLCMADKSDIGYGDLGFCLFRLLAGSRDVENWTFTDKGGWFYLPILNSPNRIDLGYSAEQTRIEGQAGYFVESGSSGINGEWVGKFSLEELKQRTKDLRSFYAVSSVDPEGVMYDLYKFDTSFKKSQKIEGEDLVSEAGKVSKKNGASGGRAITAREKKSSYLVSGPYITLQPGRYKVNFRLKCLKEGGTVTIDVISDLGRTEHGKKVLEANNLRDDYKTESLDFEVSPSAVENVEFRVKLNDSACSLDYIELENS